jgi:hypothetical protein
MHTETWYCWKEFIKLDGEDKPRLFTPWGDPYKYEFPFDFLYDSPKAAQKGLEFDGDPDAGWVLCKMTLKVV